VHVVPNPTRTRFRDQDVGRVAGALPSAYRVWLAGSLVSQLGDAALYFALGWAASAIGGSAAGLVLSAIALPRTVLLLLGGVVGDRAGARRVMITGDAVMVVVSVVLGAVAYRWGTPLALLVAAGLVIGIVDAFYLPSLGSMPRRVVGDDQLARAVALRQSGSQLVTMIGGPIGGVVVAFAGFAAAAWSDAASFAVVLAVLIVIRARSDVPALPKRESVPRAAVDGLRVAVRTPGLGPALLLVAGAAGFIVPSTSLLVPLLARHNHWSAANAGFVIGAQGVGVIASTFAVARRGTAARPGMVAAAGFATTAVGQLLVALLPSASAAVPCAVLIGIGSGTFVGNLAPVLLGTAPRTHLARIQSLLSLVQSAALLFTNNVLGALAHLESAPIALMCCSAALAGCAVTALSTPTLRHLANHPSEDAATT
jgi:MFS family permease